MDNLPRLIFYVSGVLIISAIFTIFSSEFMRFANTPGFVGLLVLLGFGLVYMNIVFISGRRFMRRLRGASPAPYIFAAIVAVPPIFWSLTYNADMGQAKLIFIFTVVAACALGAYFGHRAGLKAQIAFHESLKEYMRQSGRTVNGEELDNDQS